MSRCPERQQLAETPLVFAIHNDAAPYAQVVVSIPDGNKMDYYVRREIEYPADCCDGDMRSHRSPDEDHDRQTVAPSRSPARWVGLSMDIPITVPSDSSVRLLSTKGAVLKCVTFDGEKAAAVVGEECGHPSCGVQVAILPGQSGELSFQLFEPTAPGEARVPAHPLIDSVKPEVKGPDVLMIIEGLGLLGGEQ